MINKELQKRILSSIILLPISSFFYIKGSTFFIYFFTIICFFVSIYEWNKMD